MSYKPCYNPPRYSRPKRYRDYFQLRRIYDAQRGICAYCKRPMLDPRWHLQRTPIQDDWPTRDHFIPIADGGTDNDDNIVIACYQCNNAKGNTPAEEFILRFPPT